MTNVLTNVLPTGRTLVRWSTGCPGSEEARDRCPPCAGRAPRFSSPSRRRSARAPLLAVPASTSDISLRCVSSVITGTLRNRPAGATRRTLVQIRAPGRRLRCSCSSPAEDICNISGVRLPIPRRAQLTMTRARWRRGNDERHPLLRTLRAAVRAHAPARLPGHVVGAGLMPQARPHATR